MEMQELRCKKCRAAIKSENIHWDMAMAHCSNCGTVFSLHNQSIEQPADAPRFRVRPPAPMPPSIQISNDASDFRIVRSWYSAKCIFLIIFTVFWNGFMIMWHAISLYNGAYMMSCFGSLHTLVGLGMLYYTIACLLNTTTIWVQSGMVGIHHAPLPWWGSKQILVERIQQFYSREQVSRGRHGTSYSYEVYALLKDGGAKEKLIGGLDSPEQALYIEQELERYLGIRDMPVPEELPR